MKRHAETGFYMAFLFAFIPFYGIGYALTLYHRGNQTDNPREREAVKRDADKYLLIATGTNLVYLLIIIAALVFL